MPVEWRIIDSPQPRQAIVRVQYSIFECWLDDERFAALWARLGATMERSEDRIIAYTLDKAAARKRLSAGDTMLTSEKLGDSVFL